jgi:hypothetical protein
MAHYTKSDVEFHTDGYGDKSKPAVNVKVYGSTWTIPLPYCLGGVSHVEAPDVITYQYSDPGFTHDWIEENIQDHVSSEYFELACRDGVEMIESEAQTIFGNHVKVYQEGRSGGWVIVDGIDDFESWDAVMLAKWHKFEAYAKNISRDVPYQMVSMIYMNEYEPMIEAHLEEQRAIGEALFI